MESYIEELQKLETKLEAFLGQLIDLETGHLEEIVITNNEDGKMLKQIIQNELAKTKNDISEETK